MLNEWLTSVKCDSRGEQRLKCCQLFPNLTPPVSLSLGPCHSSLLYLNKGKKVKNISSNKMLLIVSAGRVETFTHCLAVMIKGRHLVVS